MRHLPDDTEPCDETGSLFDDWELEWNDEEEDDGLGQIEWPVYDEAKGG